VSDDGPVQGFLRTKYGARFWWGPIQIQTGFPSGWLIALNTWRWSFVIGGDRKYGWSAMASRYERSASLDFVNGRLYFHGDPS
jgi:hypothetical protein